MGYLLLISLFALGVACYHILVWKDRVREEQDRQADMFNQCLEDARDAQTAHNELEYLKATIEMMMMTRPVYAVLTEAQIQQIAALVNSDKKEYVN